MSADHVMENQTPEWHNAYLESLVCPIHGIPLNMYIRENRKSCSSWIGLRDAEILPLETPYVCMADPDNPHDLYNLRDSKGNHISLTPTGASRTVFPRLNDFTGGWELKVDRQGRILVYPNGLRAEPDSTEDASAKVSASKEEDVPARKGEISGEMNVPPIDLSLADALAKASVSAYRRNWSGVRFELHQSLLLAYELNLKGILQKFGVEVREERPDREVPHVETPDGKYLVSNVVRDLNKLYEGKENSRLIAEHAERIGDLIEESEKTLEARKRHAERAHLLKRLSGTS